MEFRFLCPSCGQKLKAEAEDAGRMVDCPHCSVEFRVPLSDGQFQVGGGAFGDITNLSYPTASGGASVGVIDLSGVAALQNIGANTAVSFRIVNMNGGSSGTWYIYDKAATPAQDFALLGTVTQVVVATNPPAIAPSFTLVDFTGNQFSLTLTGTPGSNYVVQATTNLVVPNWIPLITNAAPFSFVDSNTTAFGRRFYRAALAP